MTLIPGAEPKDYPGGPVGVLFVHGYCGSPKSMKPWAEYVNEQGYTASVPRLPGHGTNYQECNQTRWPDWYSKVEHAFDRLREQCDQVFVFGMSMGACLSLRLAEERGDQVAGLSLVNPSLFTERLDRFLVPVLGRLFSKWPGITNDIKKGGDEAGYSVIPVKTTTSVFDMWKVTRQDIGKVHQPLQVFTSPEDHVVEPKNSEWLLEHVNSVDRESTRLPNSYHVATMDNDAELIFRSSTDFLRRLTV